MDGVITANFEPFVRRGRNDSRVVFWGGNGWGQGSALILCGADYTNNNGNIILQASDGAQASSFKVHANGKVSSERGEVVFLAAHAESSNGWYKKWSDGMIEQAGVISGKSEIVFHTPFTSKDSYVINVNKVHSLSDETYASHLFAATVAGTIKDYSATGIELFGSGNFMWYAKGV